MVVPDSAVEQLGILIENMRREGYEFCVSPPRVLTTVDEEGNKLEPVEEVRLLIGSLDGYWGGDRAVIGRFWADYWLIVEWLRGNWIVGG